MAESEDLLAMADALMARHRLGRPESEPYAEFPVLDEVVELGAMREDVPVLTELALAPARDDENAEAPAESLRATLLAQLQPAIDEMIEARLKESLEPLVEKMFNDLRRELQLIAGEIVRDAVNGAMKKQLDRRESGG